MHIIVPNNERLTSNMLTKHEFTHIIGTRASEIDRTGIHYAIIPKENMGYLNAQEVAIMEIQQKRCPLNIKRHIDSKYIEIWSPNEMLMPKVCLKPVLN